LFDWLYKQWLIAGMATWRIGLGLLIFGLLSGCGVSTPEDSEARSLPLSPGIQIAMQVSGGIAGVNDRIQVSDDWQLSVNSRSGAFTRHLDAAEQMALRGILARFATLNHRSQDPAGDQVADAIGTVVLARGTGEGEGTSGDAGELAGILKKFSDDKTSPLKDAG